MATITIDWGRAQISLKEDHLMAPLSEPPDAAWQAAFMERAGQVVDEVGRGVYEVQLTVNGVEAIIDLDNRETAEQTLDVVADYASRKS